MKEKLKKILLIGVILFMTLGAIVIVADGDLDFKKVEMNSLFSSGGRTTVFINECKECAPSTTELGKFPFTNKLNVKNDKTNTLEEIDSQVTQVGFNLIYGHNKNLIIYLGEIPVELATASEDELTDVRWFSMEELKHMVETGELNENQISCFVKVCKYLDFN